MTEKCYIFNSPHINKYYHKEHYTHCEFDACITLQKICDWGKKRMRKLRNTQQKHSTFELETGDGVIFGYKRASSTAQSAMRKGSGEVHQ